jgi:AcrR family transcriptional regulator
VNIDYLSEEEEGQTGRRRYDSPLRRDQARATRTQIAAAARRLFAGRGWAGTRVRDVAIEAGVAEPTVYAAYGSKAGLALALVDAIDREASAPAAAAEVQMAADGPARQLGYLVSCDRRLFECGGDVLSALREAGRSEPDLAAAYQKGRARADRIRRDVFSAWPPGALREGTDCQLAADTFAALCNIDVYRVLTEERRWSPERVESWWRGCLHRLLLRSA